jgi:protein-disulfide isomerase
MQFVTTGCAKGFRGMRAHYQPVARDRTAAARLDPAAPPAAAPAQPEESPISRCVADTTPISRIDEGIAHFARLRLPGTPTFLVNGRRLTGGGPDSLRSLIDAELANRRSTP